MSLRACDRAESSSGEKNAKCTQLLEPLGQTLPDVKLLGCADTGSRQKAQRKQTASSLAVSL